MLLLFLIPFVGGIVYTYFNGKAKYEKIVGNKKTHYDFIKIIYYVGFNFLVKPKISLITLERFNKQYFKVPYIFRDKTYYYLLKSRTGPITSLHIKNDDGDDVTDKVEPYIGPHLDFHGATLYPKDFGFKYLIFERDNEDTLTFKSEEKITLL